MTKPFQLVNGVDAVRAAERLREQRQNQEQWPYLHVYPPADSIPVERIGTIASPAVGLTAVALAYTVPQGYRFILKSVLAQATGGTFDPGDVTWTLTLNQDPAVSTLIGSRVQGLTTVPVSLGNWVYGTKWHLERSYEFAPLDELRWIGTNVNFGVGVPNYFTGGLFGYLIPSVRE